jgi:hypothetical protein
MQPSIADTLEVSLAQETTGGKDLAPDDLLVLRALFLLLDRWDRNTRPATPVDTQIESGQGESARAGSQRTAIEAR